MTPGTTFSRAHKQIPNDPNILRERLFSQEPILLEAARTLARAVAESESLNNTTPRPRAFLVGGFVRDALLGLHPKDADVEIYSLPPEKILPLLERLFPGPINHVGASFGIWKIPLTNGFEIDISLPRRESRHGTGHTGFLIESDPWLPIEEAARRRDFTLNTLLADPLTGEIIDLFQGIADLNAHLLRTTDELRFQEDPLRVYRAAQFCARLELDVEKQTFALMRQMVDRGDLATLAPERIFMEWEKLLTQAERPSIGLALLRDLGLIARDYPELHALIGVPQEPEWHPEGDVWTHTLLVIDAAAALLRRGPDHFSRQDQLTVLFGALCHDFGKPSTTRFEDGRFRSHGHEEAGIEPTKAFLRRLRAPHALARTTATIAAEHLKPGMLFRLCETGKLTDKQYQNTLRKLLRRLGTTPWRALLTASEADFRGRGFPDAKTRPYLAGDLFRSTVETFGLDQIAPHPLLQGRDLQTLGMHPGEEMGFLIRKIEELRDLGEIETTEEALRYAQAWLGKS